jgi:hypothetical protein
MWLRLFKMYESFILRFFIQEVIKHFENKFYPIFNDRIQLKFNDKES